MRHQADQSSQRRQQRGQGCAVVGVLLAFIVITARPALGTVLNFDNYPTAFHSLYGTGYGRLTWELGNAGTGGNIGVWAISSGFGSYPNSPPNDVINAYGCTQIGIGFPAPVNVSGAYIAVQGNMEQSWATGLQVHGYRAGELVADTDPLTSITTTPTWYDMGKLAGVDRIVFESTPGYNGVGIFGMDDLTFTPNPEPAGLAAIGFVGASLLARRRRAGKRRG